MAELFSQKNKIINKPGGTLFIGNLTYDTKLSGQAYSEAANQVQMEILQGLRLDDAKATVQSAAMVPMPAFPNGKLISKKKSEDNVTYLPFINLPIIKHFSYALGLLLFIFSQKPKKIFVYNSYFFQNITLCLYKFLFPSSKIAIFVQDVLPAGKGMRSLQTMLDRHSLKFLSKFDLILPISRSIIDDFNICTPSILIQGGLTEKIIDLFGDDTTSTEKKRRAVFAGALEEYNGIGILLKQWVIQNPDVELHIFGKGTLAELCKKYSEENSHIIYHGFSSHADIQKFIAQSTYIFVLRYDIGIETKYFFPSKFWESMASDAVVLCNEFSNFPDDLRQYCMLLNDDLSNLKTSLASVPHSAAIAAIKKRQQHMLQNHTWKSHMKKIIQYFK